MHYIDLPGLCAKVSDLGDYAKALFRFEPLDFGNSDGMAEAVKFLDEDFGPVSHLFVVCGIPAHLKEHPDAWKLVGLRVLIILVFLVFGNLILGWCGIGSYH